MTNYRIKLRQFLLFAFFALTLTGVGGTQKGEHSYYDEIFDRDGSVRPVYQEVYKEYSRLTPEQREQFGEITRADFQGDNALDPLPRILIEDEYNILKKGVEQRGTALRMFLRDYFSGNIKEVEKIIPPAVLKRIVGRSTELGFQGKVSPENIAFPYGPDIIRDSEGQWRVVEDNPGYIGGPGDLVHARQTLMKRMPGYQKMIEPLDKPEDFFKNLLTRYKAMAQPKGGKIVFYSVPPFADHEDDRLIAIAKGLGIESVVAGQGDKKLVTTKQGVFLEHKSKGWKQLREPVGFVILNAEHHEFDFANPAAYERALILEAKDHLKERRLDKGPRSKVEAALKPDPATNRINIKALERALGRSNYANYLQSEQYQQVKGLVDAMASGKVPTNYTPGLDFIGDKEFYLYVDDMVRHYLKQEPVIKNIPTERFGLIKADGKVELNQELVDRVFKDQKNFVIKGVDGRGGDAVWVGPSISAEEFASVKSKIAAEPERFIAQKFVHLSVLGDKIVDLRMISAVDSNGVYVSPTPWARGLPVGGDGKVNISSSGRELAVIVVKNPQKESAKPLYKRVTHPCGLLYSPVHRASP